MCANARVESNTVDNRLCIKTFYFGISIQFVEITYPQSQIRVCKQFDRLRLLDAHKEGVDIFLDCAFLQQSRKLMRLFFKQFDVREPLNCSVFVGKFGFVDYLWNTNNYARRVQIVIQCLRLAQKFR